LADQESHVVEPEGSSV